MSGAVAHGTLHMVASAHGVVKLGLGKQGAGGKPFNEECKKNPRFY